MRADVQAPTQYPLVLGVLVGYDGASGGHWDAEAVLGTVDHPIAVHLFVTLGV